MKYTTLVIPNSTTSRSRKRDVFALIANEVFKINDEPVTMIKDAAALARPIAEKLHERIEYVFPQDLAEFPMAQMSIKEALELIEFYGPPIL